MTLDAVPRVLTWDNYSAGDSWRAGSITHTRESAVFFRTLGITSYNQYELNPSG